MRLSHFARGAVAAENARRAMMLRGFTPNGYRLWDGTEAGNLLRLHPDYVAAVALNVRRTKVAHYGKASRMGIARHRSKAWDSNELLRLHRIFPHGTKPDVMAALPGRTWDAICGRAYHDGYHRPPRHPIASGNHMLDQIYIRAVKERWTLRDLDEACHSNRYFARHKWRGGKYVAAYHFRAVKILRGRVKVRWISAAQVLGQNS
ncbi:hypothetical protein [Devosia sp. CN2-171]|uniref:hypothetical protein n=1 Tax=Devosia sp. CN2-171 TaxID=3400909 RepID=UPI003BF77EA2